MYRKLSRISFTLVNTYPLQSVQTIKQVNTQATKHVHSVLASTLEEEETTVCCIQVYQLKMESFGGRSDDDVFFFSIIVKSLVLVGVFYNAGVPYSCASCC